ncbi:F/Y-rich N-terminus-domain-containing protein [Zychaea mexicana]|uniref:F/Y-rich N-terminus-domain-containing protein n=1 Tax=Zychaea mexicana TaxID=64656 RepID=UPI0022FF3A03|nr:F/Y-rich N-terminus-domain-containing protein [Zychaea mexicana]KAI9495746.1 F/Y-rich N-terminus-domain-containing protein [Zychaea mexicana]
MTNAVIRALSAFFPKSIMSPASKSQDAPQEAETLAKIEKMEQEVQLLLERNRDLTDQVDKSSKTISRLRRQRSALLDSIAEQHNSKNPTASDEDDDDSSIYDENDDLGELSPASPDEESSSSEESSSEEETYIAVDSMGRKRKRPINTQGISRKSRYRLVAVTKDEAGDYILPVQLGTIRLIQLGRIITTPAAYHNNRYIFPVGYKIERVYKSMVNPDNLVTYTCEIKEGQGAPKFCITPEDQPDNCIEKDNPTAAWSTVMKEANRESQRTHFAVSGPEYFGMSHPNITKMIQELPGANECYMYQWRFFDDYETVPGSPGPSRGGASARGRNKRSSSPSERAIGTPGRRRGGGPKRQRGGAKRAL